MRSLLLLLLATIVTGTLLSSCNSTGSDADYTPPPSLSPVDATDQMRNQVREWRN
ncbi:MAG TPA: hypothetical protein PLA50_01405 [Bacteroidia bacterium]|nr:hypothetical protein [Bacteroidia bacterium]